MGLKNGADIKRLVVGAKMGAVILGIVLTRGVP